MSASPALLFSQHRTRGSGCLWTAGGPQASSVWLPQDFKNVYILIKIIIAYDFF